MGAPGGDDQLIGGDGDDGIAGEDGDDELFGGPGRDLVKGGDDNDFLVGTFGNDTLLGGKGDDVFNGDAFGPPEAASKDVCNGRQGNDAAFPGTCEEANQIEGEFTFPEEEGS